MATPPSSAGAEVARELDAAMELLLLLAVREPDDDGSAMLLASQQQIYWRYGSLMERKGCHDATVGAVLMYV